MANPGSLNRAAHLLDALARAPGGAASVADLALATRLPRPTVYRVTEQLLALGWLEFDNVRRTLAIGAKLAAIGQDAFVPRLQRAAATDLGVLARRLGQTLYLDIRLGLDLLCVGRFPGLDSSEFSHGFAGMRAPFGVTPATMAMLAQLPEAEARDIMVANAERYAAIAGFDLHGFQKAYERSRRLADGAIYEAVILDRRMCGLGVAICDSSGTAVAGMGMTHARAGLTRQARESRLDDLRAAAARLGARLWGRAAG